MRRKAARHRGRGLRGGGGGGRPGAALKQIIHGAGHGVMQILVDSSKYTNQCQDHDEHTALLSHLTLLLIDCAVTLR